MKAIKITPANQTAIETALQAANGKASTHCYTTYDHVEKVMLKATRRLDGMNLPQKAQVGATVSSTSGDEVCSSYCKKGYTRTATRIVIERRSTGWFLTDIEKATIWQQAGKWFLTLTPEQDAEAVKRLREKYIVVAQS